MFHDLCPYTEEISVMASLKESPIIPLNINKLVFLLFPKYLQIRWRIHSCLLRVQLSSLRDIQLWLQRILLKIHRMQKGCAPFRAVQGPEFNPFNPLEF